jgi:DNA-directed RNA polymerase subunit H (RpoH/RPB5)
MQNSSLISTLYKSKKTIIEILKLQGYDTSEYSKFTINEINEMHEYNQMDMLLKKVDGTSKIYITYFLVSKLSVRNIDDIIDDLFIDTKTINKNDTLMIITNDDANETLQLKVKYLWEKKEQYGDDSDNEYNNDGIFIVIQNIKRLQYNILNHSFVPPHRIMNKDEVEEIKLKYNIVNDNEFPELSRFDPVAQVIGIRPGQVCEIMRSSKTAIKSPYYRICVNN